MSGLGIEPVQLLTQVFNFILMVAILTRLLYRPILAKLAERRKKIEEGLKFSEQAKLELEEMDKKRQEIIDKAKEEARKIMEEGKRSGQAAEKQMVEKAETEALAVIEKGKKELELARLEMSRQLKIETVDIARVMVEKVLAGVLTEEEHRQIIDRKIKEISRLVK